MLKKPLLAAILLAANLPAVAQTGVMGMPEGSKDIVFGLATVVGPRANGSPDTVVGLAPMISVQWANGVFIHMNTVGMHLSERGDLRYGPLASYGRSRVVLADGTTRSRFTPELGGFVEYELSRGFGVSSRLMYGGSSDRGGVRMISSASAWTAGHNHHAFGIEGIVTLANRSSLQADFGTPVYQPNGGLRDVALVAHWSWELTHKSTLRAWVQEKHFLGGARSSPRLERHGGTSLVTMITWRF